MSLKVVCRTQDADAIIAAFGVKPTHQEPWLWEHAPVQHKVANRLSGLTGAVALEWGYTNIDQTVFTMEREHLAFEQGIAFWGYHSAWSDCDGEKSPGMIFASTGGDYTEIEADDDASPIVTLDPNWEIRECDIEVLRSARWLLEKAKAIVAGVLPVDNSAGIQGGLYRAEYNVAGANLAGEQPAGNAGRLAPTRES